MACCLRIHWLEMQRLTIFVIFCITGARGLPPGMVVGDVSEPLTSADGSTFLIFLPPAWKNVTASHPVLLFLHGVGGINNGKGCREGRQCLTNCISDKYLKGTFAGKGTNVHGMTRSGSD